MIKAFKYRIYPTKRQEQTLNDQLAVCCELYNAALQERRDAWSNFLQILAHKAEEAGRVLARVSPSGTSQLCLCGAVVRKTLKQRVHACKECGLIADRDHVSARLILAKALPSGVNVGDLMPCVA